MAMHNFTPPHLVRRACRKCGKQTPALVAGQLLRSPTCPKCRQAEEAIWRRAKIQASRQVRP